MPTRSYKICPLVLYKYNHLYCINQNILYLMQYSPFAQPQSDAHACPLLVAPVRPFIAVGSYLA